MQLTPQPFTYALNPLKGRGRFRTHSMARSSNERHSQNGHDAEIVSPDGEQVKLVLRPLMLEDAQAQVAALNQPEVQQWYYDLPNPISLRDCEFWC